MLKILVIKPSSLGDIVHGLQVMAALKAQRADVHITWVARDVFVPLLEACDVVDQVFVFRRGAGLRAFLHLLAEIRAQPFDWVLDMQGLARSGCMTYASRATNKVGRADARELSRLAYQRTVALPPGGKGRSHAVDILLQFLPQFELAPELCGRLTFSLEPRADLLGHERDMLLVFPTSRRAEKNWQGYTALTQRMLERYPDKILCWVGHLPCTPPAAWTAPQFINLTGKTLLLEVVSLIERAKFIVSNDSGPMHLAAAMGKPLVAIFGPTDPLRFGPYPLTDPQHRVVRAPAGNFSALSVDEVLQAVEKSLS